MLVYHLGKQLYVLTILKQRSGWQVVIKKIKKMVLVKIFIAESKFIFIIWNVNINIKNYYKKSNMGPTNPPPPSNPTKIHIRHILPNYRIKLSWFWFSGDVFLCLFLKV